MPTLPIFLATHAFFPRTSYVTLPKLTFSRTDTPHCDTFSSMSSAHLLISSVSIAAPRRLSPAILAARPVQADVSAEKQKDVSGLRLGPEVDGVMVVLGWLEHGHHQVLRKRREKGKSGRLRQAPPSAGTTKCRHHQVLAPPSAGTTKCRHHQVLPPPSAGTTKCWHHQVLRTRREKSKKSGRLRQAGKLLKIALRVY